MKRVRLKLYSYHTFLVIPFIVLFLYGHNLGQSSLSMVWRTLLLGLLLSLALFGLVWLLLRDRLKTGVFVTILLFAAFQYGVLYEFLEDLYYGGRWPFSNIHRYLVGAYTLVLAGFFFLLKFSKHDFVRINYFLNVLLALLVVFNISRISLHKNDQPQKAGTSQALHDKALDTSKGRPDIYFIVLDGYASNKVLTKYFGFSNQLFRDQLQDLGFRFCDSAVANHYYTSLSLNGTLNMTLKNGAELVKEELSDNRIMKLLNSIGYRIYYLNSGYAVTSHFAAADSVIDIAGPNEFEKSMLRHTILRLDDLVGFFARERLQSQFERMLVMPQLPGPKFCFLHFVAPHPPFVFDSTGQRAERQRFVEHSWEPRNAYVNQLKHVNNRILSLLREIRQTSPQAVIFLQSDHGPWISADTPEEIFEARSQILYSWSSSAPLGIPCSTSPVNTFRYLLNGYFSAEMPLLPDSAMGKKEIFEDPILKKKVQL